MAHCGQQVLDQAEWLFGFDFDGTLADSSEGDTVSPAFFDALAQFQEKYATAWGICTGRSLDFLLEGLAGACIPLQPDYIVTQERDLFYLNPAGDYTPHAARNAQAMDALAQIFEENRKPLESFKHFTEEELNAQWVSTDDDPAGVIAKSEADIQRLVELYDASVEKTAALEYQRNSIYLRFTHKDYCKGTAIQYLQKTHQFSLKHTVVMGDNFNDLTMLNNTISENFGAPANAIPPLKKQLVEQGGFITSSCYGQGVAEALRRIGRF